MRQGLPVARSISCFGQAGFVSRCGFDVFSGKPKRWCHVACCLLGHLLFLPGLDMCHPKGLQEMGLLHPYRGMIFHEKCASAHVLQVSLARQLGMACATRSGAWLQSRAWHISWSCDALHKRIVYTHCHLVESKRLVGWCHKNKGSMGVDCDCKDGNDITQKHLVVARAHFRTIFA